MNDTPSATGQRFCYLIPDGANDVVNIAEFF